MSYLYARPDFPELIEAAAQFHGIANPAIVEKDYYVTEALRLIARDFGGQVIFKGGTSLSKGWKLIRRFSEDIDLYISPGERGESARNTLLKELAASVAQHPKLTLDETRTVRVKGMARATTSTYSSSTYSSSTYSSSTYSSSTYSSSSESWSSLSPTVLLEAGIQSGTFPTEDREIRSLLAELLADRGIRTDTDELDPFVLPVLHFRRTCIEKLYALHDKVERGMLQSGIPIGSYARHYYDVSQLLPLAEVQEMLKQSELAEIAADYRRLTRLFFPNQMLPQQMNLIASKALFPNGNLKAELGRAYLDQCETLCYGTYPSFDEVLDLFTSVRDSLQVDLEEDA